MIGELRGCLGTTDLAREKRGWAAGPTHHALHTPQYVYVTQWRQGSSVASGSGAATRGREGVWTATWVSRRRIRLEERKKMVVDGECEEQNAQELGDSQRRRRVRTAIDTTRAERATTAQPLAGPKWRSSGRVQCLPDSVSEVQHRHINASSISHSTSPPKVKL